MIFNIKPIILDSDTYILATKTKLVLPPLKVLDAGAVSNFRYNINPLYLTSAHHIAATQLGIILPPLQIFSGTIEAMGWGTDDWVDDSYLRWNDPDYVGYLLSDYLIYNNYIISFTNRGLKISEFDDSKNILSYYDLFLGCISGCIFDGYLVFSTYSHGVLKLDLETISLGGDLTSHVQSIFKEPFLSSNYTSYIQKVDDRRFIASTSNGFSICDIVSQYCENLPGPQHKKISYKNNILIYQDTNNNIISYNLKTNQKKKRNIKEPINTLLTTQNHLFIGTDLNLFISDLNLSYLRVVTQDLKLTLPIKSITYSKYNNKVHITSAFKDAKSVILDLNNFDTINTLNMNSIVMGPANYALAEFVGVLIPPLKYTFKPNKTSMKINEDNGFDHKDVVKFSYE